MRPVADCALARAIAAAALATEGVDSLSGGAAGEAATYGPGERVVGVRVLASDEGLWSEVRLVLSTLAVRETADKVRRAACIAAARAGQPLAGVDICVDDVRIE